ncbi:c-type cytochrome biogenesis protein CcmI [Nitrosomonas marina]|uniref:Cytochrome c-type biogenesis protein CcmH n=1 Tax=Nitrosomonas marina TaxID=917 RepID=A0A1H8I8K7_9PROT|nr:c-type cytochrome biogenesis protein CcmI [Nitrosomonas marina]SEN64198.1 cytochrome c-type biogenesis protein CcmH [Nitrosomonas marina]
MTAFWVISGIFIIVALLFIIPTLLKVRNIQEEKVERDAVNVTVYRDQLKELDRDLENDILTQEQYNQSKQELQQRMLQDVQGTEAVQQLNNTNKIANIAVSTVVALTLPIAAIYLYLEIGDTRGLLPQAQLANAVQMSQGGGAGDSAKPEGHDNFNSVLENLIARLNNNPEDIEGWFMLARTYAIMKQYEEAAATYARLNELIPDNPQILSDYADVLAMTNAGSLAGEPSELIQKALSIDPEYPKALALAGTVEFEKNHFDQAANYWERLLAVIPADSQLAKSVSESIAEARSMSGGDTSQNKELVASNTDSEDTVGQSNSNNEHQQISSDGVTQDQKNLSISGRVTISDALATKANPSDTLFIYARAESGPKMPLAILRLSVRDLPTTFTLTDAMAMTPAMKLSSFENVVVEARVSKSGQAVPSSGDFQGLSEPVTIGNNNVMIEIDSIIP